MKSELINFLNCAFIGEAPEGFESWSEWVDEINKTSIVKNVEINARGEIKSYKPEFDEKSFSSQDEYKRKKVLPRYDKNYTWPKKMGVN